MQVRILSGPEVEAALPMPRAIEAMRRAFAELSAGHVILPLRSRLATERGTTLLMPAHLRGGPELGIKIVSVYPRNRDLDLPVVTAAVLVLDPQTGLPLAFMDGTRLTALRTGAAGGLAADLLARRDACRVGLFGAGVQARAQLEAVRVVRRIESVRLLSRSRASAERLAAEIASWQDPPAVMVASTPQEVVEDAEIVIAATSSSTPVFDGNDLRPGTHVTGVGSFTREMQEVDAATVRRARVVVDSREGALAEAGDLIIPGARIDAELGEILNGLMPGRKSDEEITFFKSVGVAVQDAVAAAAVLREAEARGLGRVVEV